MASRVLSLLLLCGIAPAQQFEVASVKPSGTDDPRTLLQVLPGGGLRTSGATLRLLVTVAYDVRNFQIVNDPGWMSADRFDIVATADPGADTAQDLTQVTAEQFKNRSELMKPKLRALLAERFKLSLRPETREQPVYALVIAKSGSKLEPAGADFRGLRIVRGEMDGNGATLEMLTTALANQVGRPVLNRTGLTGAFQFKLRWAPQAGPTADDATGPSIFTAVQEQLGLRLESTKGPAEVLVVDHVEKPSAN